MKEFLKGLLQHPAPGWARRFVDGLGVNLRHKVRPRRTLWLLRFLRRPWATPRSRPAAGEDPADVFRWMVVYYSRVLGLDEAGVAEKARDAMRILGYEERHEEGGGTAWVPSAPNMEVSKHA